MKIAADKEYFLFGPKNVRTIENMLRIYLVIFGFAIVDFGLYHRNPNDMEKNFM